MVLGLLLIKHWLLSLFSVLSNEVQTLKIVAILRYKETQIVKYFGIGSKTSLLSSVVKNKWNKKQLYNLTTAYITACFNLIPNFKFSDTEMIVLGGVNQGDLSIMEKYDVEGKLVATLPSMKIARYIIYSIAFKDFV